MSRIGRMPIAIPAGVTVEVAENNLVTVKGPKGTLTRELPAEMEIKQENGVSEGYTKKLEIQGVGYRAEKSGKTLTLHLGYSHPVVMEDPEGVESTLDGNNITVSGISKEKVGQYAAEIRDKRRPEPYKGKGIRYADEHVRRLAGKTGKK